MGAGPGNGGGEEGGGKKEDAPLIRASSAELVHQFLTGLCPLEGHQIFTRGGSEPNKGEGRGRRKEKGDTFSAYTS